MAGPSRDDAPAAPMSEVLALFGIVNSGVRAAVVEGGWSHQVWRVETNSGVLAVKQMRREHGDWWIDQLLAACEFERSAWRARTIAMAEPVEVVDGSGVLGELPGQSRDHVYRCHRWVDGVACAGLPPTVERSRRVGATLAAMRALRFPCPGTTADQLPWNALDAFDETVAQARSRSMPWADTLGALSDRVARLRAEFTELARRGDELCFLHRDFDPKNASTTPGGDIAVFDWDYAGARLLSSELLDVAVSFAGGTTALDRACAVATVDAFCDSEGSPIDRSGAAAVMVEEGFRWLMLNAWRALGHRNVTTDQAAFANTLVPTLAEHWPASADVIYDLALELL